MNVNDYSPFHRTDSPPRTSSPSPYGGQKSAKSPRSAASHWANGPMSDPHYVPTSPQTEDAVKYSNLKRPEDVVYTKELTFELREFNQTTSSHVHLRLQIFSVGHNPKDPDAFRIELSNPEDLFFHYQSVVHPAYFRALQARQNITVDFSHFLNIIIKIVNDCADQKDAFTAVLKFRTEDQAKLAFFQNLGFKYVELLAIEFHVTPADTVKDHAQKCFTQLKHEYQIAKSRLVEVLSIVKAKNPSLLLYLQQDHDSNVRSKKGARFQI